MKAKTKRAAVRASAAKRAAKRQRPSSPPRHEVARALHSLADAHSPISSVRRPAPRKASPKRRRVAASDEEGSVAEAGVDSRALFSSPAFHNGEDAAHGSSSEGESEGPPHHDDVQVTHTIPHMHDDLDPSFFFIKHLPPLPAHYRFRACTLPRKTRQTPKCTLVLDLDETLLHSSTTPMPKYDLLLPVVCNNQKFRIYVRKRPHLELFMSEVCQLFEVIVFTASQRVYAEKVLNVLDPHRKWIKFRQYRESCVEVEGNLLKDLSVLGRDLSRTIIIDNSIHAFAYQIENGIPIKSWFDDENDTELADLLPQLRKMAQMDDVRPFIRNAYKLHEHVRNAR